MAQNHIPTRIHSDTCKGQQEKSGNQQKEKSRVKQNFKVALLAMPFIPVESPSHSLGLLKSYFNQLGSSCDVIYLNLNLAEKIGLKNYSLCGNPCFAESAFGNDVVRFEENSLQHIPKNVFQEFIDESLQNYDWQDYDLVMFTTSMSLATTASFAFARHLKEQFGSRIGLGGSAMYWGAGQEYVKIPWIDYVFTGHVDADSLRYLTQAILFDDESYFDKIPDFCRFVHGQVKQSPLSFQMNMDQVPVPDYSDFFQQLQQKSYTDSIEFKSALHYDLVFAEFGRGCFYGDRQTCTFCSEVDIQSSHHRSHQNGMEYLRQLSQTYPQQRNFFFTEPLMGQTLLKQTLPEWNKIRPEHQRYVCEVRPWLNRDKIKQLAECGVIGVQCGIEALHPALIKLLRKGQKVYQCIAALKWFKTYSIHVFWNILVQIPGEKQEYYHQSAEMISVLRHLPKPSPIAYPIFLTKGTPYWRERDEWKFENLRPNDSYQYIIPSWLDLEAVSFSWEYDVMGRSSFDIWQTGHLAIQEAMNSWCQNDSELYLSGDKVTDSRFDSPREYELNDEERDCLVFCDSPQKGMALEQFGSQLLSSLIAKQLLLESENRYVSLVIIPDKELYYKKPRDTDFRRSKNLSFIHAAAGAI